MALSCDLSKTGVFSNVNRKILRNINDTIGRNKFTINCIQGSNNGSTLEEGQDVTLETTEDVGEFIKKMEDSSSGKIIVENVRGILYISNTNTSYWLHTKS